MKIEPWMLTGVPMTRHQELEMAKSIQATLDAKLDVKAGDFLEAVTGTVASAIVDRFIEANTFVVAESPKVEPPTIVASFDEYDSIFGRKDPYRVRMEFGLDNPNALVRPLLLTDGLSPVPRVTVLDPIWRPA